jgi:hypothetical protein
MSTFEYIVTLHRRHDLGAFYEDMETAGHTCVEVPEREVECCERREISRNTHYMLTEEEASFLRSDSRVRAVEKIDELPELKKMATQTSYFNRGYESDSNHANHVHNTDKNWGLYRHFVDTSPANWGKESGNASAFPRTNQTISWDLEGEHVDIIINDDLIDPDHPEYAVNADGTGGSRVQSIDWTDYYSGSVDHWKSNFFDLRQSHGALCASSAAGNTHGLARKANLYCINSTDRPKYAKFEATRSGSVLTVISVETGSEPIEVGQRVISSADVYLGTTRTIASFGTGTGGVGTYNLSSVPSTDWPITSEYFTAFSANGQNYMWDYIRGFHKKKAVNSATNRRNPTVVNCSYGFATDYAYSLLSSIQYRGTTYTSSDTTWTNDNLYSSFGIVPYPGLSETDSNAAYFVYTSTSTSLQSDIEDAIEDGIIIVAAAGNTQNKMDVSGGDDYNNTFNNNSNFKYQGGGLFGDTGAIMVGALDNEIDSGSERKSDFSNTGPSVDVYAPGSAVLGTNSGDEGFGKIVSWSRANNVVTFNIEGPYYPMSNLDYVATSSAPYNMRIKITMDSTTSLNGYHSFLEDYSSNPSLNPDGFKINNTGPDVALTTESGSFYAAQQVSNYILYNYDLSDPRDDTKYLYWANGTSFACPMTAGLVACWTGYFGRLDKEEFKALLAENAALNKMTAGATDDYDDKHALLGGPNSIERYAGFRASSGFTYPQNTHKARSTATIKGQTSYVAFPRQRVLRYGA